ncbi:MAG: hypothetical protein GF419_14490 [Ignavibacteriales bacterium]|nr:hypothetical protein [Ignavibacteriales bacterium]
MRDGESVVGELESEGRTLSDVAFAASVVFGEELPLGSIDPLASRKVSRKRSLRSEKKSVTISPSVRSPTSRIASAFRACSSRQRVSPTGTRSAARSRGARSFRNAAESVAPTDAANPSADASSGKDIRTPASSITDEA